VRGNRERVKDGVEKGGRGEWSDTYLGVLLGHGGDATTWIHGREADRRISVSYRLKKKKAGVPDVQHCFGAKGLFSFNGARSFLAIAFYFCSVANPKVLLYLELY